MPHRPLLRLIFAVLLASGASAAGADTPRSAPFAPAPDSFTARTAEATEPPVRIAAGFGVEPLAELVVAQDGAAEAVAAIAAWNRSGRVPLRTGIERPLPGEKRVRFDASLAAEAAGVHAGGAFVRSGAEGTVWGASVKVADAHRLRLRLDGVDLPAATRMWVYGDDGRAVAFDASASHEGTLWTPSVEGETLRLEVELPDSALTSAPGTGVGFTVGAVGQIFRLDATGAPILDPGATPKAFGDCLVDVSCVSPATFPVVDQAVHAIAMIEFVSFGALYGCSGGLLNLAPDAPPFASLEPPFLTANHCVSSAAEAATVEGFWDHRTATCDGPAPDPSTLPRSFGSRLLVTSPETDFTLLGLDPPAGRSFLGWNALTPIQPKDTELHRLSHPILFGPALPQQYTRYRVKGAAEIIRCDLVPGDPPANDLTKFHHTVFTQGGTFGGSSGAPLMLGNGQVVGQLLGACGPNTADGCSVDNDEIDGNFYSSFALAAPFLGASEWQTTPAVPGFEFQVWITQAGGNQVLGSSEAACIPETFCASGALPGRPEVFVKVIGPRPNGFLWVQISRFTPSQVEVVVRQTSTGASQSYLLPAVDALSDDVSGLQDREAFRP